MRAVDDSLIIVGNDSIKDFYKFIAGREQKARESDNFATWVMYMRILTELSLGIINYAGRRKEVKGNAENSRVKTELHGKRHRPDHLRTHEEKKDHSEGDGLSPGNIETSHEL